VSKSTIEWTNETWNPVTGCTEVSPGCDHCYAKTFAERWRGVPGHPFERGFDLTLRPERLDAPLHWAKPRMVFVNSMSDLFHRDIPDDFIRRVFETMEAASAHTFQVLTKRPERMRRFLLNTPVRPLTNVWLGVSIESNDYAWRADMLRQTPAHLRWVSAEPLLGPLGAVNFTGMDWVVIGGESGHGARPMDLEWARGIVHRARSVGAAVFVKQLGAALVRESGGKGKGGEMDLFPSDLRIREFPAAS
jgi:protein gp37